MNTTPISIARSTATSMVMALIGFFGFAGSASAEHEYNNQQGGGCVSYEVSAYGGDAALRFMHNTQNLKRVHGSGYGKLCKGGYVTVELSKRNPATKVGFSINGEHYYFGSGDHGHKYANNWYRKYVKVHVPYQTHIYKNHGGHNGGHSGKSYGHNGGFNNGHYSDKSYGHSYDGYANNNHGYKSHNYYPYYKKHHYKKHNYNNQYGYNNYHYRKHKRHNYN